MSSSVRFEQPGRPQFTMEQARASHRAEHTGTLIVMGLSFACTIMSLLDLFLLATG